MALVTRPTDVTGRPVKLSASPPPVAEPGPALAPPQAAGRRRLLHDGLDVWLLGGASIAVWGLIVGLQPLQHSVPSVGMHLGNIAAVAAALSLLVNYPHFMASYSVAYGRGMDYVLRHWFTLVAVPGALAVWLILAVATVDRSISVAGDTIDHLGQRLLGVAVSFMFITVGWHYTKQAYGCCRVGAQLCRFRYSSTQARAIRYGLFPLWIALWVRSNSFLGHHEFMGLEYASFGLPAWTIRASDLTLLLGGAVVCGALLRAARANACRPPALTVVPLAAMFVWWIPGLHNAHFALLVPFFHSLQYLPFVARVERSRRIQRSRMVDCPSRRGSGAVAVLAMLASGWLAFELLPGLFDGTKARADGVALAAIVATVFINVHHYFIDHVAWRLSDPIVRSEVLGPSVGPGSASLVSGPPATGSAG